MVWRPATPCGRDQHDAIDLVHRDEELELPGDGLLIAPCQ
jgi:hypothetical protein